MSDQELARALLVLFGALSVADSVLTYFGLRYGRLEGNPIGRLLLRHGPVVGYSSKLFITALMCLGFWYIAELMPMATLVTIAIIVLAYAVVIIKNAIALAPL